MSGLNILNIVRYVAPACCIAMLAGCAYTPVAAWDKGDLARPAMQFDADRLEASFIEHIYFSKEAASGGRGVGGGGCGCN
jgi:hypothetical protein